MMHTRTLQLILKDNPPSVRALVNPKLTIQYLLREGAEWVTITAPH